MSGILLTEMCSTSSSVILEGTVIYTSKNQKELETAVNAALKASAGKAFIPNTAHVEEDLGDMVNVSFALKAPKGMEDPVEFLDTSDAIDTALKALAKKLGFAYADPTTADPSDDVYVGFYRDKKDPNYNYDWHKDPNAL